MFYSLILFFLAAVAVFFRVKDLKVLRNDYKMNIASLKVKENKLKKNLHLVDKRFHGLEGRINETFFMCELAGKVSSVLDKESILRILKEEMQSLSSIEDIDFFPQKKKGYLLFRLETKPSVFMAVKVKSKQIKNNVKIIVKMANLCIEKSSLYKKLQTLSMHDSLTGIYNRRYFNSRLNEEFERVEKFKLSLSLLMVDIDHFKKINDNYGHLVGDVVLKEVAKIIKKNIREIDFTARYGGEEFVVILQETDKDGAIFVGERIRENIASKIIKAFDEDVKTTVSLGLASYPQDSRYPGMLLELADKALYRAKNKGRNRLEYF